MWAEKEYLFQRYPTLQGYRLLVPLFTLSYTLFPSSYNSVLCYFFFSSPAVMVVVHAYITAKKIFFDIVESTTRHATCNYFNCDKNSLSYFYNYDHASMVCFFHAGIIYACILAECRVTRTLKCQNHGLEYLSTTSGALLREVYSS